MKKNKLTLSSKVLKIEGKMGESILFLAGGENSFVNLCGEVLCNQQLKTQIVKDNIRKQKKKFLQVNENKTKHHFSKVKRQILRGKG